MFTRAAISSSPWSTSRIEGTARFDEAKILRVVNNLARNAAEAMADRGGKFTIVVARDKSDGALVLTFTDNGPGVPQEIEHRLFQSFVTSGKKGGTGLGLAIVKKIAEEHDGTITRRLDPERSDLRAEAPSTAPETLLPGRAKSRAAVSRVRALCRAGLPRRGVRREPMA